MVMRDENKYYLLLSYEKNIPQPSTVGEFRHKDDSDFKFYIVLNDKKVKQAKHRSMCVGLCEDEDRKECAVAYITNGMLLKLQKKKYYISSLWHELGHVHRGDLLLDIQQKDISDLRKSYIQQGKVIDSELGADEFACRHYGRKNLIRFLKSAVEERKQFGDNNSNLAIKELELRIGHLETYCW